MLTPAQPPFTRKRIGAHYVWGDDLRIAYDFACEFGLELFLTDAPYQVAKLLGRGVALVIYPHKTTAGHYHLRVRDENSRDKDLAARLMALLARAAGFNCAFSFHWPVNAKAHELAWSNLGKDALAALRATALPGGDVHPAETDESRKSSAEGASPQ